MNNTKKIVISYNKVFISFISSSFTSLILSFFLNAGIFSIPFYVYGVFILVLAYFLYYKKITFNNVIIPKVLLDLTFTTYWSALYLHQTNNLLFFLLPVIVLVLYGKFNLHSFKSNIIRVFLISYMVINIIIPIIIMGFDAIGWLGLAIYLGSSVYSIFLFDESLNYELQLEPSIYNIINRLTTHDINNIIEWVSFVSESEKNINEGSKKILSTSVMYLDNIKKLIRCDGSENEFSPKKIIDMISEPNIINGINGKFTIVFQIPLFVSIVKNIYSNSLMYADSNNINFKLHVYNVGDDTICFEDNCGGMLDMNNIKRKKSSKNGNGHGIFLHSLFFNKEQYNLESSFENYDKGVRIYLKFLKRNLKND